MWRHGGCATPNPRYIANRSQGRGPRALRCSREGEELLATLGVPRCIDTDALRSGSSEPADELRASVGSLPRFSLRLLLRSASPRLADRRVNGRRFPNNRPRSSG
ncbi:MAG: hypothetical protein ACK56F_00680, partial [bacterium]